jgi:hypothetical protein
MKQGMKSIIFHPFGRGLACFFERGAYIKNLGVYTFKKLELVLQGQ